MENESSISSGDDDSSVSPTQTSTTSNVEESKAASADDLLKRENALRQERLNRWSSNKTKNNENKNHNNNPTNNRIPAPNQPAPDAPKPSEIDPRFIDLSLIHVTRRPSTKSLRSRFQHSTTLRQRGVNSNTGNNNNILNNNYITDDNDKIPLLSNSININNNNNNNNRNNNEKPSMKRSKADIIEEFGHRRILYEMNMFDNKWYWIDSLPTDDSNDHSWLNNVTNVNLYSNKTDNLININVNSKKQNTQNESPLISESKDNNNNGTDTKDDSLDNNGIDIESELKIEEKILGNSNLEIMSIGEFNYIVDEARKACINEPLFPKLGCCGYCKEFYVNLCDWSHLGVLSIQCMFCFSN